MILGLTGGIAAGKTEAMDIFEALGAKVFYADKIAHDVLRNDAFVISEIKKHFKDTDLFASDNGFDRKKLAKVVFASKENVDFVNNLIHPLVKHRILELTGQSQAQKDVNVVEVPLLFEAGWQDIFDFTVLVEADKAIRIKRCLDRSKDIDVDDVKKRMNFQMPFAQKEKLADFVIVNEGSVEDMKKDIKDIWVNLKIKGESDARRK